MADLVIPNDHLPKCPSHLFTVRVWIQKRQDGEPEWHGKVQHVASGDARYFRDWATLLTYIQQMLADRAPPENA
ncbi:hypothetical protein TFLX_02085 [Thermoflexales bacterium]|nr:hypothetical protein TFLX_02085 [Thermoflexales bacterium]